MNLKNNINNINNIKNNIKMILKIFCIKHNILKYIYLSIKYFFKDLNLHFVLKMYNGSNLSGRPQKSSSTSKA
jgi:hypothetical protein